MFFSRFDVVIVYWRKKLNNSSPQVLTEAGGATKRRGEIGDRAWLCCWRKASVTRYVLSLAADPVEEV